MDNNLWSWMLRRFVLPAGDRLFGQKMMRRLAFLERAQWWDKERLYEERDLLLRRLIRACYDEVPFYRELMDSVGVRPEDIRTASDLSKLPVVDKQLLRPHYPARTVRRTPYKQFQNSSSGSTGQNFYVMADTETVGWYRASFLLSLEWAGWRLGEEHVQTGITPKRSLEKTLKDRMLNCHYVSAYNLTDSDLDATLELLERRRIAHLWGYPGSLYLLARRAAAKGWNRPMRSLVTWGDNLYGHYRSTIERVFQARIFDTYGCGEGFHIAAQCGHAQNYHIHTLDVVVEYLDVDGNAVAEDQPGRMTVTRLHPGPMPILRYQVGDLCVRGSQEPCECGRGYDRLRSIEGRDTDFVVTPEGNRLIVHFFTGILEHFPEIDCFQVVQEELGAMRLRIVPKGEFSRESAERVIRALVEHGAQGIEIDLELVDSIPTTPSGKRRFVVSSVAKRYNISG